MNRVTTFATALMIVVVTVAADGFAQVPTCSDCVLGLYDDVARTSSMGTSTTGQVKSIYLGIDLALPEDAFTGFEFSVHGMRQDPHGILFLGIEWLTSPESVLMLGTIHAPADTTTGTGGLNVAWSSCHSGSQTLARLSILHMTPIVNAVFTVKRRFPPSNPLYDMAPVLTRCNKFFEAVRITGNCYVLNWDGDPNVVACLDGTVGVEPRNWSGMKSLYR